MATSSRTSNLPSEVSCPICLEDFQDPVSIHCGHNFCRSCITHRWEYSMEKFSCPQCWETTSERSLRPNQELARILHIARRLSLKGNLLDWEKKKEKEEEEGCEKHQEPLNFFCKEDQVLLCVICRESRAHRSHSVRPVPEVAQEYKVQIQAQLKVLKEDRDKFQKFREAEMRRNWEYLEKTEVERQRVLSQFQGFRLVLEDHACHLLAQLRDLEKDLEKMQEENITNLTKEISRLDTCIQDGEEKCQQPAKTFLEDITSTLRRLEEENLQLLHSPLPKLEKRINHLREKNLTLEKTLRSFQDILMFELPEKMPVTLDPTTAHPQLIVAADGRSVRWEDNWLDSPMEVFGPDPCVLAHEGITSGRFCWEVEVSPVGSWAVGVARESLKRREEVPENPEMELWSMGVCEGQFWALTSLERIPLYQVQVPKKVKVSLDYEKGQVAFFDADKKVLIFTFPAASFKGESVHPWFLVWSEGSQITLCP
ncbi:PREDICTED: tripartite motif-containing protein 10-like [Acanthisitta chloris]|uniref:tripartite motif-containing protein 10-like n=1 Tax=Acanthisitta chloris TaxID=57068 RepID=UPI0004F0E3E3|nr:PREDICTED: tripartite motif-containing protein 10-like [Acanthisitta chloris]